MTSISTGLRLGTTNERLKELKFTFEEWNRSPLIKKWLNSPQYFHLFQIYSTRLLVLCDEQEKAKELIQSAAMNWLTDIDQLEVIN